MQYLPYEPPNVSVQEEEDQPSDDSQGFRTEEQPEKDYQSVKIVALDDLDKRQIETFTAAKGIKETQVFLHAIERADAWPFTARPQDLEELVEFWNDHQIIGSRLEIVQNSISRRLAERDQGRADARPLSAARTRDGARRVAAATTMTKEQNIRVPDGADNSKGIPVADILPDWDDREQATLLSRPIFDEAIYGAVRFHHRSVREFLTAEWLVELLKRETSRRKIDALLFRNQYGLDVVVPTLRPILPWLALLDDKILERLRKVAPEVLLEGGDPSKLPLEIRRSILRQVCQQLQNGHSTRTATDYAAVQRFAQQDLVADIKELIAQYSTNEEITSFLLRMVWIGKLKGVFPKPWHSPFPLPRRNMYALPQFALCKPSVPPRIWRKSALSFLLRARNSTVISWENFSMVWRRPIKRSAGFSTALPRPRPKTITRWTV